MDTIPQDPPFVQAIDWPTPDVFADESPVLPDSAFHEPTEDDEIWWAEQNTDGCGPEDLDPEQRRIAACESVMMHQLTFFPEP
jgi:hypothetical protein